MTNANRRDPRLRSVLGAHRRVLKRPAHAPPRMSARGLLWWIGGLGALVLLGSWIGAAAISTSGHGRLANPPRSVGPTIAVPSATAEPTPTLSASVEPGDSDPTDSADCGPACERDAVGADARSPRPAHSASPWDPKYDSCAEAKAHGYGPYVRGEGPEYAWYRREDTDNDGVVCG